MRIVHVGSEGDFGMQILVIVLRIALQFELKNAVGEASPTDEYDAVEETDGVVRGEEVDAAGTVLFEVFVFDGEFVVSHGLFAVDC